MAFLFEPRPDRGEPTPPRDVERQDELVADFLDHVQHRVYRSGSWERAWLAQRVPGEAIQAAPMIPTKIHGASAAGEGKKES